MGTINKSILILMKEEEMDPTQNPIANPNPNPAPAPAPGADPVVSGASAMPNFAPASAAPASAAPAAPAASSPAPNPAAGSVNPMGAPTAADAQAATAAAGANPVIQPGGGAVNPVQTEGLLATDPIMKPEPAPGPDPVQQELEAPMKAAAPVPGSIGSSISGDGSQTAAPAGKKQAFNNPFKKKETPSVAFNDPAMQNNDPNAQGAAPAGNMPIKPKNNKTTLIVLIAVAAIVIIVLIVILIATATGGFGGSDSNRISTDEVNTEIEEPEEGETTETITVSCRRAMTPEEAATYNVASGTISVVGSFDEDDELTMINVAKYSDEMTETTQTMETTESTETTETTATGTTTTTTETTEKTTAPGDEVGTAANLLDSSQIMIEDLTPDVVDNYYLTTDDSGEVVTTSREVQDYLESLAFTCGE